MARSSYVYVVQTVSGGVVAGFTVKHELVSWLRCNEELVAKATVWRLPDGGTYPGRRAAALNVRELIIR